MRTCRKCQRELPLTDFHKKLNGHAAQCKECCTAYNKERWIAIKDARPPKEEPTSRICNSCLRELPFSEFHKKLDGYQTMCKPCRREANGQIKRPETLEEAFWKYVSLGHPDSCWEWTGCRDAKGYGIVGFDYDMFRAHRISYELHYGAALPAYAPGGIQVCHHCDNPPCVNPAHLFLGTTAENAIDSMNKGRKKKIGTERRGPKLTIPQVSAIRAVAYKTSATSLANAYDVSVQTVYGIWQGRRWEDIV